MQVLLIVGAYLLGSIPFGYLLGKLKGIDIRKHGSGNVGATNVARVLGKPYGVLVYILDFLKGFIPTLIAVKLYGHGDWVVTLVGLAAVLGHMFSIFLGFRGGKGVATASGVLFAINPFLALIVLLVWGIVFKLTGYVSVGSIAAALAAVFLAGIFRLPFNELFLVVIVAVLVLIKHQSNVQRLMEGKELKV
jgi:glycerol-3-phosphate acyltransferase PlsY